MHHSGAPVKLAPVFATPSAADSDRTVLPRRRHRPRRHASREAWTDRVVHYPRCGAVDLVAARVRDVHGIDLRAT
jgi:hypothetical protein